MPEMPKMPEPDMDHWRDYTADQMRELHEAWRAYALQVAEECAKLIDEHEGAQDTYYASLIRSHFPPCAATEPAQSPADRIGRDPDLADSAEG